MEVIKGPRLFGMSRLAFMAMKVFLSRQYEREPSHYLLGLLTRMEPMNAQPESGCAKEWDEALRGVIAVLEGEAKGPPSVCPTVSVFVGDTTPIRVDEFIQAASIQSWIIRFNRNGVWDPPSFDVVADGELKDSDFVYGWKADDPRGQEYEDAIAKEQIQLLTAWAMYDRDRFLGGAAMSINPLQNQSAIDVEWWVKDRLPPRKTERERTLVREARVRYHVESQSSSDEFHFVLAQTICKLRGGIWIDDDGRTWGTAEAK